MAVSRRLKVAGTIVGTFLALLGLIWTLAFHGILSPQEAGLMAVALFGMYVGFGILIGVHRLISKLD